MLSLAGLAQRLVAIISGCVGPIVMVPGGGAAADVVADLDSRHGLGQEASHWLALRAAALNAHALVGILEGVSPRPPRVCGQLDEALSLTATGVLPVLDPYAVIAADDRRCQSPGEWPALAHHWRVSTDTVALRVAARLATAGSGPSAVPWGLWLLKSVSAAVAEGQTLGVRALQAAGLVDTAFAEEWHNQGRGLVVVSLVNVRDEPPRRWPVIDETTDGPTHG